jgi:glycerophosphoryl diester phosphodiesterase
MRPCELALFVACGAAVGCAGRSRSGGADGARFEERPRWLVEQMPDGPLKTRLRACADRPLRATRFSIGHRGAPLGFPEHTKESYEAAARMGAGLIECDVTFTKDLGLVCRHSQCDLATTTNILAIPALAARCSSPRSAAAPATGKAASPTCCTSDLTLNEFESLCGKMEGTAACGRVMSHAESIALIDHLGRDFIPELKPPSVPMPFQGTYSDALYAQQLVDEYEHAGISPGRVHLQSSDRRVLAYWRAHAPRFGENAIFLEERVDTTADYDAAVAELPALAGEGIRVIAPPMWALLALDEDRRIVPSRYAMTAKRLGLDILTWTLERGFSLEQGGGYYYRSVAPAITSEGDVYVVLDVLARQVKIRGIFSDWPATATYYADCMGL